MGKYHVRDVAGHARIEPVGADRTLDLSADRARAEAARSMQLGKILSGTARGLAAGLAGLWRHYQAGQRKRVAIAELARFDDRLLADIGLERGDIAAAVEGLMSSGNASAYQNHPAKHRGPPDAA